MSVATVSYGYKLSGIEFVYDYDPSFPEDFDPPTDDFDVKNEREYYFWAGYTDGAHSTHSRADECPHYPPGIQSSYKEGYEMGLWHHKLRTQF